MAQKEINPFVAVVVGAVILVLVVFFGFRAVQPASPPPGSYTPGVPPWEDPKNPNYGKIKAPPLPPQGSRPEAAATSNPVASP